jgi:hypothetical protein
MHCIVLAAGGVAVCLCGCQSYYERVVVEKLAAKRCAAVVDSPSDYSRCMEAMKTAIHEDDARAAAALANISDSLEEMRSNMQATAAGYRAGAEAIRSSSPAAVPSTPAPRDLGPMYTDERPLSVPRECVPDTPFGSFMSQTTHCPH